MTLLLRVQPPELLGRSDALRAALERARTYAPTRVRLLLAGETGVGKQLFAQFIHVHSRESNGPFVAVNCAELMQALATAQLFGYKRGAFTGATEDTPGFLDLAAGGTCFLDEVAELGLDVQDKLLHALSEGFYTPLGGADTKAVRCRWIFATHRDLEEMAASGRFRADLLGRLGRLRIVIPPLRQRAGDVPELAASFLARSARENGLAPAALTPAALARLRAYAWPRNVRELQGVMDCLAVECAGRTVTLKDLEPYVPTSAVNEPERIVAALRASGGCVTKAAAALGMHRATLYRAIAKYEIEVTRS